MENKRARKMRNFKKQKHRRALTRQKQVRDNKAAKIERNSRVPQLPDSSLLHVGKLEAIANRIAFENFQRKINRRKPANENTVIAKIMHVEKPVGNSQRKRRKLLRSVPQLSRSKKYSR